MNRLYKPKYNLDITLLGGQSFGWDYEDGWFYGSTQERAVKLRRAGEYIEWQTWPKHDDESFLREYLRLDFDYDILMSKIQKDEHIVKAILEFPDLWLLKQDFEETVIQYLFSANKNIKSIRQSVREMSRRLGDKVDVEGRDVYLFPQIEAIAEAPVELLLECKAGFRSKYIKAAAQHLIKTDLAIRIEGFSSDEAREELKKMNGVGDKIADCILIYGLSQDHITPLDVWGKRILTEYYGLSQKAKYEDMSKWITEYFEGYAGWAGQFLFEYIRQKWYNTGVSTRGRQASTGA